MYFRKTVHCWCVGSSWIDLPVRGFINCLFTLEMPQAILKFKKVSDIVIVIAGLEFVSVTQYSGILANIHSTASWYRPIYNVSVHHIALMFCENGAQAVYAKCNLIASITRRMSRPHIFARDPVSVPDENLLTGDKTHICQHSFL